MSLSKVNDTLKEIKEDTNQLNQNFDDWFDNEKRNRLRDEEARREASRGTSAAAGGIAGIGGAAAAAGAAPEQEEGGFSSFLTRYARFGVGALTGVVGTGFVAKNVLKAQKLEAARDGAIKSAEAEKFDLRNKGVTKSEADLYKARQAQNKIETDIANAEKARAEKYKLNQIAKGIAADKFDKRGSGVPSVTKAEAEYFSKLQADLKAEGARLKAQTIWGPTALNAPGGDSSPKITSTAFGAVQAKYNAVKPQMPTVEPGKFEKPADIARIKVEDIRVEMTTKGGQTSYSYRNAKNGQYIKTDEAVRILQDSGYKLDGTPDPDFRPVIDTKSSVPKVQRKSRPSGGKGYKPAGNISAKGLGVLTGLVGVGSTASAAIDAAGGNSVLGTKRGVMTAKMIREFLSIPSDFSDAYYSVSSAIQGKEYTPQYGPAFREAFDQTNINKELTSSDSPTVHVNKTLLGVLKGAEALEMRIGEGIMALAKAWGGKSFAEQRQENAVIQLQQDTTRAREGAENAQRIFNEVESNRPYILQTPEVINDPLLDSLRNTVPGMQPFIVPVPMQQTSPGGPGVVPNNAPMPDTIKPKDNQIYRLFDFGQDKT